MSINRELKKGFLITFISKYSNIIFEIIIGAILARLLSPEEFGIVAVILVFTTFFNLLSDFGVGTAVIQNKQLNKLHIQSIFNYTIIFGLFSAIGFSLLSYPISIFYNNDIYIKIGFYLSFAVFFYSIDIVPQAIIRRKREFLKLETAIVCVNVFTGIIAIYQAYNGYSYFALINRAIYKSILLFIINLYNSKFIPSKTFNIDGMRMIYKYSTFQFSFNFVNYFSRNLDNILIGRCLGVLSLGYYDKAYRLMLYPVQSLTHVITPVLHPVLSKYQNEPLVIYNHYKKILGVLAFLGMPLSVFLYFSAYEIIYIMYGNNWLDVVPIFKILALTVWIQMTLSSTGAIFQALGRTDLLFISGLISAMFMVSGILYGIFAESLLDVAYGLLIAFLINLFQGFGLLFYFGFNKSPLKFLTSFKYGAIASFICVVIMIICIDIFEDMYIRIIFKGVMLIFTLIFTEYITGLNNYKILFNKK